MMICDNKLNCALCGGFARNVQANSIEDLISNQVAFFGPGLPLAAFTGCLKQQRDLQPLRIGVRG